jgi:hypothetical protein
VKPEQIREWYDLDHQSDEPWYDARKALVPVMVAAAQHIERVLGSSNCVFEPFDLGHQLGALYNNPDTGKRHAVRVKLTHDGIETNTAIRSALTELEDRTAA